MPLINPDAKSHPLQGGQRVAIVGAGLLGRLLAWQLARRGMVVELFEQDDEHQPRGAAWTAAGMVSPLSELGVASVEMYELGCQSLAIWPQWLATLGADADRLWQAPGTLVLAHGPDRPLLRQFEQQLRYKKPDLPEFPALSAQALTAMEPALNHSALTGLLLPGEAYIDGPALLARVLDECQRLGVVMHFGVSMPGTLQAAQFANAELVFDCRGRGSDLQDLRGVRGEVMHLHCPGVQCHHALRLMHPRYLIYVVPRPGHHFLVGATEIESEDRSPMSLRSMLELGTALYSLNPAFAEARIVKLDSNLRPALAHNHPCLQQQAGVWQLNGLYRHGYLLAPALITQVLALLGLAHEENKHENIA